MLGDAAARFDSGAFLRTVPNRSGVYRMVDRREQVLYVGKARNLRRRLSSWLQGGARDAKGMALLSHTASVEVTVTHTETEALLLENNLIKEHRPRYNVILRDDKSYPWIHLADQTSFPRFAFYRGSRRTAGRYFGPYASAGAVRQTIALIHKLFRVRQCTDAFFRNRSRPCLQYQIDRCTAPCVGLIDRDDYAEDVRHATMFLEGRSEAMIGELVDRMEAAAGRLDFELAARYRDQIAGLRRVQERQYVDGARGDIDVVAVRRDEGMGVVHVQHIRNGQNLGSHTAVPRNILGASDEEILEAFLAQHYLADGRFIPRRIVLDRTLDGLDPLVEAMSERSGHAVAIAMGRRGHRAHWVRMARENAEVSLRRLLADQSTLNDRFSALADALALSEPPSRVECFDVSHTDGEATVASCVVFGPEGPLKSDYRRYNIRGLTPGDDYAAMEQVLTRRYAATATDDWPTDSRPLPDLLLVDGGRGQLDCAIRVLEELDLPGVAIAAVAKGPGRKPGFESLYRPGNASPVRLPGDSPALHLVQRIRDEAHRFAITGHRSQRSRRRRTSTLESLPGIGAVLRQRLLTEFGGLAGVRRAGIEDLTRVRGVSPRLARIVYERLREAE